MFKYLSTIWKPLIEITIMWFFYYKLLIFIQGTRAVQVLKGLTFLIIVFFITQIMGLDRINWILAKIFAISVIAFLIIFQPELRRGLARLGQNNIFSNFFHEEEIVTEIVEAFIVLANKKIGAIVAIEREIGLRTYIESGVLLDAKITKEVLTTIFMPNTILHDGGVVIQGGRIAAAGCLFPLTQNPNISKTLGTRHRAAMGLTEETDAIVIVVSEETGTISLSVGGRLTRDMNREELFAALNRLLYKTRKTRKLFNLYEK